MDPQREPRATEVVGAVIVDDLDTPTRVLAARRTEPEHLAGGWELPGGKVDPGESRVEALHRELREELGITVELGTRIEGPLPGGFWALTGRFVMEVRWAAVVAGEPQPLEDHDALRWLAVDELDAVGWLPADRPVLRAVAETLGGRGDGPARVV